MTTDDPVPTPAVGAFLSKAPAGTIVLLTARPARRRDPSATVWRLLAYDPASLTAVCDLAQQWDPAGLAFDGAVPDRIARWVSTVLGPHTTISVPAHHAGPHAWNVHATSDALDQRDGPETGHDSRQRDAGPGQPCPSEPRAHG